MKMLATAALAAALSLSLGGATRADQLRFVFGIEGAQQVPSVATAASGSGTATLDTDTNPLSWNITFSGVTATLAHFHGPAPIGVNAGVQVNIGAISGLTSPMVGSAPISAAQANDLIAGLWYVNIHSSANPGGEIRGQLTKPTRKIAPSAMTVHLDQVAAGLTSPVWGTHAGDGSGRLFVVDQAGKIRIIDASGALLPGPFLDITSLLPALSPGFDERGLLGLAFHPDYANNGRFFVRYSAPRTGAVGEPCVGTTRGCHKEVLAEFAVSAGNPNVANPTPTILFEVDEPQFNHNAGNVAFGPDGFLYFTLGDGGGAHDGLADVPPSHGPGGNGQNINTFLGTVIRIDVDSGAPYAIPAGNPFVGMAGLDEIYAYGFRNPYRFSFDDGPGGDGRLFVADVGQNLYEEVHIVDNGGNYGWVIREGCHCFNPLAPTVPPVSCATTGAMGEPLIDPVAEYDHTDGIAIVGGFVYRGSAFPELTGKYVFGEFSRTFNPAAGRIFWLDADGTLADIFEFRNGPLDIPLNVYVLGFGEDEDGELYLLTSGNLAPVGALGRVFKITRPCAADADGDDTVNFVDITTVLANWLNVYTPGTGPGDADANGVVEFADVNAILSNWLSSCP